MYICVWPHYAAVHCTQQSTAQQGWLGRHNNDSVHMCSIYFEVVATLFDFISHACKVGRKTKSKFYVREVINISIRLVEKKLFFIFLKSKMFMSV